MTSILRLAAVTLILIAGTVFAAASDVHSFDSASCSEDTGGHVTVRLKSGVVLSFPNEGFGVGFLQPAPAEEGLDPYGCPNNPLLTGMVSLGGTYRSILAAENPGQPFLAPSRLRLFGHDSPLTIIESQLTVHERGRARRECELISEVIEYCRCQSDPKKPDHCRPVPGAYWEPPLSQSASTFRALPGRYEEIDGIPLSGGCLGAFRNGSQGCKVLYKLQTGLYVRYDFNKLHIRETQLLELDQDIREFIKNIVVVHTSAASVK
ncbi:MAG: hypothetical protein AAF160_10940 [Pseudomonadota bacterium]